VGGEIDRKQVPGRQVVRASIKTFLIVIKTIVFIKNDLRFLRS
jgi:hypothetical protein